MTYSSCSGGCGGGHGGYIGNIRTESSYNSSMGGMDLADSAYKPMYVAKTASAEPDYNHG
ncbi:hypothetical protein ACFL3V_03735 [Nanoarchaeota archaeon]